MTSLDCKFTSFQYQNGLKMAVACLAMILAGCTTQGEHIKQEQALEVTASVETAEELQETLGSPSVTIPTTNGKIKWVYEGVYSTPGMSMFIPYLNYAVGRTNQKCTRLTVLVDREDGSLSDWSYTQQEDSDHWINQDETCRNTD